MACDSRSLYCPVLFFLFSWGCAAVSDLDVVKMGFMALTRIKMQYSHCLPWILVIVEFRPWGLPSELISQVRKPLNNSVSSTDINTWTLSECELMYLLYSLSAWDSPASHRSCPPSPGNFQGPLAHLLTCSTLSFTLCFHCCPTGLSPHCLVCHHRVITHCQTVIK